MFGDHKDKKDEPKDVAGAVQAMATNSMNPQAAFSPEPTTLPATPMNDTTPAEPFTAPSTPPDLVASAPVDPPTSTNDQPVTPLGTPPTPIAEEPEESVPETEASKDQEEPSSSEAEDAENIDSAAPASTDAVLAPSISQPSKETPVLSAADTDGLLDIKQNALEQLKPLVDHLEHTPEEKFDALMMMIRASDDQTLIQPAYEAAQKITDDTKRAEALLDVVNEINYLTSSQQ